MANRTGGCLQSSLAGEVSKFPPLARARLCPLAPPSGFDWIRVCERHRGRFLLDYLYPSGVRRVWQGGTNIFCVQGPCAKSRYSEIRSHQEELNNKNGEAAKLVCVVLGLDIFHRMNARQLFLNVLQVMISRWSFHMFISECEHPPLVDILLQGQSKMTRNATN